MDSLKGEKMLVDMHFKTRAKAKEMNTSVDEHWKYHGTAKEGDKYISWRTNTKKHVENLLNQNGWLYKKMTDVVIDKGKEDFS